MHIIYLKNTKGPETAMYFPYFYKVVDENYMTVTENSIQVEIGEDFHDNVSFIKNKLCDELWSEISREEFDEFYKKTISLINKTSIL